jgi:hypothetical protein
MWRFFGKREVFVDIFKLLTAAGVSAILLASAAPVLANGDCTEGCECVGDCGGGGGDDPKKKGNNGWGNGSEGTNNGSDDGGTQDTKIDESRDAGDTSPGPDKFTTR